MEDMFPRAYVEQLRAEAAENRTKAKEAHREAEFEQWKLHATVRVAAEALALGRLHDPADLFRYGATLEGFLDEEGVFDPVRVISMINALISGRPHLAASGHSVSIGTGGKKCALYRHWDRHGTLLYVGITDYLSGRGSQHARSSEWVRFAYRVTAQWYDTREEAVAAERLAIADELPVFNKQHAREGRDQRVQEYVAGLSRVLV